MTPSSTPTATQGLTAEEQAAYDFIANDFENVRRFMYLVSAARTTDIDAEVVPQLAEADATLRTKYAYRIAEDLVGGRVHTLERTYEAALRSMLVISGSMKAALAAPTKVLAIAALQVALRERPRLAHRVQWTAHELDALKASADGDGSTAGRPVRKHRRNRSARALASAR